VKAAGVRLRAKETEISAALWALWLRKDFTFLVLIKPSGFGFGRHIYTAYSFSDVRQNGARTALHSDRLLLTAPRCFAFCHQQHHRMQLTTHRRKGSRQFVSLRVCKVKI